MADWIEIAAYSLDTQDREAIKEILELLATCTFAPHGPLGQAVYAARELRQNIESDEFGTVDYPVDTVPDPGAVYP